MNSTTKQAYRDFRKMGVGGIVGQDAMRCLDLARAETVKRKLEYRGCVRVVWEYDNEGDHPRDWGWTDSQCKKWDSTDHECFVCTIEHHGGVVASLSGIWDPSDDYRRTLEAELISEAELGHEDLDMYFEHSDDDDEYPEGTELLFDSSSGQYIPQRFANEMRHECIEGVDAEDWAGITDPENEWYWDAWTRFLDNAVLTNPETGQRYRLEQDGDVWLIPIEGDEV